MASNEVYWMMIWRQFYKHKLGRAALWVVVAFCVIGIYAPFLAASKPLVVQYDGVWYFPLFRYLFYSGYYTKGLDIFFNILIFTVPAALLALYFFRRHSRSLWMSLGVIFILQISLFIYFVYGMAEDPAFDASLSRARTKEMASHPLPSWKRDLQYMTPYAKLNLLLRYQQRLAQQERLKKYAADPDNMPTLWQLEKNNQEREIKRLQGLLASSAKESEGTGKIQASLDYILERRHWLESQLSLLHYEVMPLIRPFHWEDDAGGDQSFNQRLPFWELTRINRKDLVAALIFGVRISLVVGVLAISLALVIGVPIGAFAGFYGGKFDIIVSRLLEIWEAMPTFFMLLMVVAILQSKSIFLVIAVIGIFGWTTFSRYIRGEFFKQRNLPYVEACRSMGFHDSHIMFSHIMPNALPPILTLIPFSIMAAITSEAGLSFLGLGEEGSCSWGVLMAEGRSAFPGESYLLWPPAILLIILLVAIALVGDSMRDALDPKMHR